MRIAFKLALHLSPLARVSATGPDSQVFGRPGAAARAQLEVAPGPAPGRVVPGCRVTLPSLPLPYRLEDGQVAIGRGGVGSFKEWTGIVDAAALEELRQRGNKLSAAIGQQATGLDWYKSWSWSRGGYRGTFKVGG